MLKKILDFFNFDKEINMCKQMFKSDTVNKQQVVSDNIEVKLSSDIIIEKETDKSIAFYIQSSDEGCVASMNCLGIIYLYGYGVPKDIYKALGLFTKAAELGNKDAKALLEHINSNNNIICNKLNIIIQENTNNIELPAIATDNDISLFNILFADDYIVDLPITKDKTITLTEECEPIVKACEPTIILEDKTVIPINPETNIDIVTEDIITPEDTSKLTIAEPTLIKAETKVIEIINDPEYINLPTDEINSPIESNVDILDNKIDMSVETQDATSLFNMGFKYYNGDGVDKDINKAIDFYVKSAQKENRDAMFNLGEIYYQGIDVPQDLDIAIMWITKAAERAHLEAMCFLGINYLNKHITSKNPKDLQEAFKWIQRAATRGHIVAQYYLGFMYHNGKHVVKDIKEAIIWYTKSAEQGYPIAEGKLGLIYHTGDGVDINDTEALKWIILASEHGHKPSIKLATKIKKNI